MQINFQFPAILRAPRPPSVNHLSTTKLEEGEDSALCRQSKLICINVAKAKQKPTTNQKLPSVCCLFAALVVVVVVVVA